jgi:hypothetical protein
VSKSRIRLGIASALGLSCAALAFTARSRPVLVSISPDPSMVRPRNYCLMNPFRDRSPERAAERYLPALRDGHLDLVADLVAPNRLADVRANERAWPIRHWRIANRHDTKWGSRISYWVDRGNGYQSGVEEEVFFDVRGFGERAHVVAFDALY